MRRIGWLFLLAIIFIVVAVDATYLKRKGMLDKEAPARPAKLEMGLDAKLGAWCYSEQKGATSHVSICAKEFRQMKDSTAMELQTVEMKMYNKDGTKYDLVKTASALCDTNAKTLFSDGEVDITMAVPDEGPQHGRIVKIHSSGVKFETQTGKASTDRPVRFEFNDGGGTAVGADYDPQTRDLHLRSQISLDWRGKTPESVPMHFESGEAYYKERESKVILLPWSKMTRDTLTVNGKMSVVTLDKGEVREADVEAATGVRDDSDRKIEFGADGMVIHFADKMVVTTIQGDKNARLISTTDAARTTVTSNRLDLGFQPGEKESTLSSAVATGKSVAETVPIVKPGADPPDTKVLHSEVLHMKMRPGGQDIDSVETDGAGTLDFVPNQAGRPKRVLTGDKFWIKYGEENRIDSFRTVNASTRTEKPRQGKDKPVPPPGFTKSKELFASFDPKTSELAHLEQKSSFEYDEGDRHARADHATLDQQKDLMTLEKGARMWDSTGSAAADRIIINQGTGDFAAEGHVASTHMPDQKGNSSAMLKTDEIMQARAQKMTSTDDNQKVHYEGNAVAWQGANRIEADKLDIDRDAGIMQAHGNVVSQFQDKDKNKDEGDDSGDKTKSKAKAQPDAAPIFTVVRAPEMVYTEETRVAHYKGGVTMQRPDLTVTAKEIRAFLNDADSDSSLDKALSDGTVKIVSASKGKTRTGTAEHSEYYADDEKVILSGGRPLLVEVRNGKPSKSEGDQLTWWANDDRLLVNGVPKAPAKSLVRKK